MGATHHSLPRIQHRFVRIMNRVIWSLTPQILRHLIWEEDLLLPELRCTTWLDGLRGCAALMVFNFHFFYPFSDGVVTGYGFDAEHRSLFELPLPRLLCHGAVAVNIFFVCAGYVCSANALQLMTHNNVERLLSSIASSVFRRVFRLYLPVACMMLMTSAAAYIGLFEYSRPLMDSRAQHFPGHLSEPQPAASPTIGAQLNFCLQEFWELLNVFRPGPFYPAHDNHLWSIQYEFRGSMHLYIVLVAFARLKPCIRLGCRVLVSAVYLSWDRWEGPLFFLGAAMAQYDVLRTMQSSSLALIPSKDENDAPSSSRRLFIRYVRLLLYCLSIYLMSFPIANYKRPSPGYTFLNRLIPAFYTRKEKFPASIGVIIMIYLLSSIEDNILSTRPNMLHQALTSRPARYLAKNMFAIYLVHGPLLHIVGYAMPHLLWKIIAQHTRVGWMLGVSVGWAAALTLTLLAADLFTREIDARCANLIKWLEEIMFVLKEHCAVLSSQIGIGTVISDYIHYPELTCRMTLRGNSPNASQIHNSQEGQHTFK